MTPGRIHHPDNTLLLEFLAGRARRSARVVSSDASVCAPEDFDDPYHALGSHPDVVERVWDQLGAALPVDCKRVVCGTPGLVCPTSGVVLVVALGTQYALRIHSTNQSEASSLGLAQEHSFESARERLCLAEQFGPDWFFGRWHDREATWCTISLAHAR